MLALLFILALSANAESFYGWSPLCENDNEDTNMTSEMSEWPIIGVQCTGYKCGGLWMFNNRPEGCELDGETASS